MKNIFTVFLSILLFINIFFPHVVLSEDENNNEDNSSDFISEYDEEDLNDEKSFEISKEEETVFVDTDDPVANEISEDEIYYDETLVSDDSSFQDKENSQETGQFVTDEMIDFGQCGESVYYELYIDQNGDYTLKIRGSGNMYDDPTFPELYRYHIKNIVFEEGSSITSIGERAFCGFWKLISVSIPDSVTYIGESAFSNCRSLTSVIIPDSVTSIGIMRLNRVIVWRRYRSPIQ